MTKEEFAEKLAGKIDIPKSKAHEAIDAIFSTEPGQGIIAVELDAGRDFTVTGFGTFHTRQRASRQGRNPKTGETVALAGKYVPHFKPGKDLRERVNDPGQGAPGAD